MRITTLGFAPRSRVIGIVFTSSALSPEENVRTSGAPGPAEAGAVRPAPRAAAMAMTPSRCFTSI